MRHQGFHKRKDFLLFLTENRQFHKFIIITMILLFSHDSVLRSTLEGSRGRHALVEFAQAGSIGADQTNSYSSSLEITSASISPSIPIPFEFLRERNSCLADPLYCQKPSVLKASSRGI
jgi:hypothetical protein